MSMREITGSCIILRASGENARNSLQAFLDAAITIHSETKSVSNAEKKTFEDVTTTWKTLSDALPLSDADKAATANLRFCGYRIADPTAKLHFYPEQPSSGSKVKAAIINNHLAVISAGVMNIDDDVDQFNIPFAYLLDLSRSHPDVTLEVVDTQEAFDARQAQWLKIVNGEITVIVDLPQSELSKTTTFLHYIEMHECLYHHVTGEPRTQWFLHLEHLLERNNWGPEESIAATNATRELLAATLGRVVFSDEAFAKIAGSQASDAKVYLKAADFGLPRSGSKDRIFALNHRLNAALAVLRATDRDSKQTFQAEMSDALASLDNADDVLNQLVQAMPIKALVDRPRAIAKITELPADADGFNWEYKPVVAIETDDGVYCAIVDGDDVVRALRNNLLTARSERHDKRIEMTFDAAIKTQLTAIKDHHEKEKAAYDAALKAHNAALRDRLKKKAA